jgi:hypothetical protein
MYMKTNFGQYLDLSKRGIDISRNYVSDFTEYIMKPVLRLEFTGPTLKI